MYVLIRYSTNRAICVVIICPIYHTGRLNHSYALMLYLLIYGFGTIVHGKEMIMLNLPGLFSTQWNSSFFVFD